ncbi:MAG: 3-hydroxy-3-methylglutaryl CoA synthase [Alteromonadaceae bacterium]|jgi:3-hydroxy-3-methylglutaryl CoA synthase|uniref:hydroxymethylglutaryl-CoA synthase family protein n=1 Tax=Paraglaciecola chathamensis TaxID=368405 RepID=UPI000C47ADF6|nr:3-oxoacyl-[acyl-carrier-protein] synthase III C-terminal domain-containing protein [Paraglaciecola agarilytica]MBN24883.1 3-hydroxy-3-methylglutaryl CoA synthase [Alteromonadaceae bacterium]|tara:strand:+ start:2637 stop:4091 length:1455 start_codon:yes stop_codon:yes gene_type:complete
MIGITAYGAYVPRLRLIRSVVAQTNAWYAPGLVGKGKGTRSMANWDEDSITMAVAAARDCLGKEDDRSHINSVFLASTTLPFADRLNSGLMAAALTLQENVDAVDMTGSPRAAMSALSQALTKAQMGGNILVAAADKRKTRAASTQELDFGDGAASLIVGSEAVLAEYLSSAVITDDFVDHFRATDRDVDYNWEERWIRDEGVSKIVPKAVAAALTKAKVNAKDVDHFIFPTVFKKLDLKIAQLCGVNADAVVDNLAAEVGDTGSAHALLMLSKTLENAKSGDIILISQFGQGAETLVFKVTDAITSFKPQRGFSGWLSRGVEESNYTRFLAYNDQIELEKGMRGEQDKKTALSTLYRHKDMITGFIAGRCKETGLVFFPPTRISYDTENPLQDTQVPYKLADLTASIASWSADYLSFSMSPPNQYGMVDFDGGGRLLMEFTDVAKGDVENDKKMEMVFRIKDFDRQRGFKRYFWKATPVKASL